MQQLLYDIVQDVLSQLFGVSIPRGGAITITNHAFTKMADSGLSFQQLEDAFRFGEQVGQDKIMRAYQGYTIGLIYKVAKPTSGKTKQFVILTCWKGVRNG